MLASRGPVYESKESAMANAGHPGCKCEVVPSDELVFLEGYDKDEYKQRLDAIGQMREGIGATEEQMKALFKEIPIEDFRSIDPETFIENWNKCKETCGSDGFEDVLAEALSKNRTWKLEQKMQADTLGLSIQVDEFVPCLKRASDGMYIDTEVIAITKKEASAFRESNGWFINWGSVPDDVNVYKLTLAGDNEAQGLIGIRDDPQNQAVFIHWAVSAPHNRPIPTGSEERGFIGVGGHLFAIAAQESMNLGYNGFVYGMASNARVLQHYIDEFKAQPIGSSYRFFLDEAAAEELLRKYTWEKK